MSQVNYYWLPVFLFYFQKKIKNKSYLCALIRVKLWYVLAGKAFSVFPTHCKRKFPLIQFLDFGLCFENKMFQ